MASGIFERWRASLDNEAIKTLNSKTKYRNLDRETQIEIIKIVENDPQQHKPFYKNETLDRLMFKNYLNDCDVGNTAIYPFSGRSILPDYIFEKSEKIIYIDNAFDSSKMTEDQSNLFGEHGITLSSHDLKTGLPQELIEDLGLIVIKGHNTEDFKNMHRDIQSLIRPGGLVACSIELAGPTSQMPIKYRNKEIDGKHYSLMHHYLYRLHGGGAGGLAGYTVPVDYGLHNVAKRQISQIIGKDVFNLSDLTSWYFFEA